MFTLYKKCDICSNKINKLQNPFNLYALRVQKELKCKNCNSIYKTNKFIAFDMMGVYASLLVFSYYIGTSQYIIYPISAILILSAVEFIVLCAIPLYLIKKGNKDDKFRKNK